MAFPARIQNRIDRNEQYRVLYPSPTSGRAINTEAMWLYNSGNLMPSCFRARTFRDDGIRGLRIMHGIDIAGFSNGMYYPPSPSDAPFLAFSSSLPTMCGGATMYVLDAAKCSHSDLEKAGTWYDRYNYGLTGYSSQEEDWDESLTASGTLGQILIEFSPNVNSDRRDLFLKLFVDSVIEFNRGVSRYDECDVAAYKVTVQELSDNVVGVFTAYDGTLPEWEYCSTLTVESMAEYTKLMGNRYTTVRTGPVDVMCDSQEKWTDGLAFLTCATIENDTREERDIDDVIQESSTRLFYDAGVFRHMLAGGTTVLTDNSGMYGGGTTSYLSTGAIAMLMYIHRESVEESVHDELLTNYAYTYNTSNLPVVEINLFEEAHNPNEGAHEIMGIAINFLPHGTEIPKRKVWSKNV